MCIQFNSFITQVPTFFKFVDVFDLFYKLHFVFNMHYNGSIKSMMEFCEAFIYESGKVSTTDAMDQIFNTLIGQVPTDDE